MNSGPRRDPSWLFCIDVGGTFTDVVARDPEGNLHTCKLLSSAVQRGVVEPGSTPSRILDSRRREPTPDFWRGHRFHLLINTVMPETNTVAASDPAAGALSLNPPLRADPPIGAAYELRSGEEAPVMAVRRLMGLRIDQPVGPVEIRLGTTRATNALLERKGAKTLFVTTCGFADVLRIGYQDRPRLFDLNIRKRDELYADVLEIDERLDAAGNALHPPDPESVRRELLAFRGRGFDAVAVCLLHAHVNPAHEEFVAALAAEAGFPQVSVSSRVARLERIVPRGDTTVADAFLSGVIRGYVDAIRGSLPDARILLMTSAGGLLPADRVLGKDTILSGPAGGVVGCAAVARRAGFPRVIGFDMGGTSTDVCRIDAAGGLEYTHETVKADVRLMTPMLAVETVAAGGGSLCAFDGNRLTVGPESAGADPGPACYGRGGPLSLTDANLYLGRVVPTMFPFPLDRRAVEEKLAALSDEVSRTTGIPRTPRDLAQGFVDIANAHMAAAIKRISIARGYDLREYALLCFGGAGGQHACAVAELLGIRRVLISPLAGVLSAYGISETAILRTTQRGIRLDLDNSAETPLRALFDELIREARNHLLSDGVPVDQHQAPRLFADLSYRGQSTLLSLPFEPWPTLRERFETMHRSLYGFIHEGRGAEVRTLRVELSESRAPGGADFARPAQPSSPSANEWQPSDQPIVLAEEHGTIVIDPGWSGRRLNTGDVVLTRDLLDSALEPPVEPLNSGKADPVQLELFHNRFAAIAEQMGETLRRTALSVNVRERLDFSCAVFDAAGRLVANAPHIPVHLGGMSDSIRCLLEDVPRMEPGDVFVTNDPYRGGSHLNDVTVIAPVHDETGRIIFFAANRAHHAEIGGLRPGSMPPDSTCLADEGVLIRAFRVLHRGRLHADELLALLTTAAHPSRCPGENLADLTAQIAANRTGARELLALVERFSLRVVHDYMGHIQRAAEAGIRRALAARGRGTRRFRDALDDGSPIQVAVTLDDGRARFDFTGSAPVHPGNLNANRAIVTSAVIYCLRCLLDRDVPLNAGVLDPVEIILPEGLLHPPFDADPRKCPAVVGGNVETSQRVVDCILGALELAAASQGTMNNLLLGNDRFGYYETICGGAGAGPGFDGADAVHTHMTNTRLTDPEVLEARYPVRLVRFQIRRGSGGQGRFHGGCGVIRELEFLEPLEVSILSQRRTTAPFGLRGGRPGLPGRNVLLRADTRHETILPPIAHFLAAPGDRLTIETPGGGGYGAPV